MIKLVVMDVDGTLTDGRFTIDQFGNETKTFNVKDGMGAILLHNSGIKTAIITGRNSKVVENRANQIKIDFYVHGCNDKVKALNEILNQTNINKNEVAFMGDDINDIDLMNYVELSACPADAVELVKKTAKFVSKKNGGYGAFREFADYLLKENEKK